MRIRESLRVLVLALFCTSLFSCCEKELGNDNTDINNYQIAFKEVESAQEDEIQVITDAYSTSLNGDFGLFSRRGLTSDCDKEVVSACKDAESRLNDVSFKGSYTIEAVRITEGNVELLYSKTYSSTKTAGLLQQLFWEQGGFSTAGERSPGNDAIRTAIPVIVNHGEKYTVESANGSETLAFFYDSNGQLASPCFSMKSGDIITIPDDVYSMHISYRSSKNIDVSYAATFNLYLIMENGIQHPLEEKLLTIIDDDGSIRYYTDVYPVARAKKASISSAVIAQVIDHKYYMSWDNISDAYCHGMEILCHTYSHPLTTDEEWPYDLAFFEEDYRRAKNILKAHGITPDLLVFSGSSGLYARCQEACKRTSFEGAFLAGDNNITFGDTDRYKIPRFRIGNDTNYHWEMPLLKGMINKLASSGGWMVWMVHSSSTKGWVGGTEEGSSAYMLGEIIDYARANGIKIVTAEYGFKKTYLNSLQ